MELECAEGPVRVATAKAKDGYRRSLRGGVAYIFRQNVSTRSTYRIR